MLVQNFCIAVDFLTLAVLIILENAAFKITSRNIALHEIYCSTFVVVACPGLAAIRKLALDPVPTAQQSTKWSV